MSAPGAFGARLRQEREGRGVSLDELSRATKIRRVFLEALEGERWEAMPSRIFVVGYLRAVAEHLHADAAALQRDLEAAWPAPAEAAPAPAEERPEPRPWPVGLTAVSAAVAAGALLALWLFLREPAAPAPPPAPPGPAALAKAQAPRVPVPEEAAALPPDAGAPGAPGPEGPVVPPPAAVAPETPAPAAPPAAPVAEIPRVEPHGDLWIEVSAPCWMELYAGEKRLVFRQVQAGEHLSFDGHSFSLTLGDASACRVLWKGRPVALPTQSGTVARGIALGEVNP